MWRATRFIFPKRLSTVQRPALARPAMTRSIHSAPADYNGIQTVVHHFRDRQHLPYLYEYLMWTVFGSVALHLIWLKMDFKDYSGRTSHKIKLLEEFISRLERGEQIPESLKLEMRMILMNEKAKHDEEDVEVDDEYLNKLIASSEEEKAVIEPKPEQQTKIEEEEAPVTDSNWAKLKENAGSKDSKFFL